MLSRVHLVMLAGVLPFGVGCDTGPTEGKTPGSLSVSIDALPDTIYGRFFAATAHGDSIDVKTASLTIDPGTASEQVVPSEICASITPNMPTTFYWCGSFFDKTGVWTLYGLTALDNGHHTIRLDVVDASGRRGSAQRTFVTYVPDMQYAATFLDAGSASDATASGINATGMAVGWIKEASGQRAAAWSSSGTLSVLDAATSQAIAVNATGDVVGTAAGKPVLWSQSGRQELGGNGSATAINSAGLVGITRGLTSMSLWQNGTLTDFAVCLPCGSPVRLCGVSNLNDLGQAVGPAYIQHGNAIVAGYQIDVSFPGPPAVRTPFQEASSIVLNNRSHYAGLVVGSRGALFYGGDGHPSHLLAAEFGVSGTANNPNVRALNNQDELLVFEGLSHTAYLMRDGRVSRVRLSDTDLRLDDVTAINDNGTIVGHATNTRTSQAGAIVLKRQ